jgi:hypothetical protein
VEASCWIYKDGSKWQHIATYKNKEGVRQIPVGKYTLGCSYNAFEKKDIPFEVKAGETAKLHVLFTPLIISAKCSDTNANIHYEIYASNGRLVEEKSAKCSEKIKVTLDSGKYRVEAKVADKLAKAEVNITEDVENSVTVDMTQAQGAESKEELIKADTPVPSSKSSEQDTKAQKMSTMLNQAKEFMSEEDKKKLKEASKMLGNLLGEGKESNKKADDEFNKMSKDLEMFSK